MIWWISNMRRYQDNDCNACYVRDCDCECKTCINLKERNQSLTSAQLRDLNLKDALDQAEKRIDKEES